MNMHLNRFLALVASLACLIRPISSHSWVEQLTVIAPNGTFVGEPGYPRGNVLRGTAEFGDPAMTYLLPPLERPGGKILPKDNICKETQRSQTQTEGSPRLQAPPGAAVALRYQENGHVTLPDAQPGKPPNRGSLYVYGTTDPRPDDSLLSIHKVWNTDGTGGDGRGMLLSKQNYDDGRCYQVNGDNISRERQAKYSHEPDEVMGADLWCQQDIALPANVKSGNPYTLYWVWDWPTAPNVDPGLPEGKPEIYTTCMDIDIVPKSQVETFMKAAGEGYASDQPLNKAAIPTQMAGLDWAIKIPGTDGPTTLKTLTSSTESSTKTTSAAVSATSKATGTRPPCTYQQEAPPTPTTPAVFVPIPTGALPSQDTKGKFLPILREGYRSPRAVTQRDSTYEEYRRRSASAEDDVENSTADVFAPAFRSPRLSGSRRGRFFPL